MRGRFIVLRNHAAFGEADRHLVSGDGVAGERRGAQGGTPNSDR